MPAGLSLRICPGVPNATRLRSVPNPYRHVLYPALERTGNPVPRHGVLLVRTDLKPVARQLRDQAGGFAAGHFLPLYRQAQCSILGQRSRDIHATFGKRVGILDLGERAFVSRCEGQLAAVQVQGVP